VSQSNPVQDDWSVAQVAHSSFVEPEAESLGLTITPVDYQALLQELAEAQTLDEERRDRIYHLEQALDQALLCIAELKTQVHDQQVLEAQLANTEEFAYVQQQAIARLKLQIAEQGQALEIQSLEIQQRDQAVEELLVSVEIITQTQQREIERVRLKLMEDQREAGHQRSRMGLQIQDLQVHLESRQHRVGELEAETLAARTLTASLQVQLESARQQVRELSAKSPAIAALRQDFARAQGQVEELEGQIAQQTLHQARWQQNHQVMEEERDRLQTRVNSLEQQTAEMQEQVLHQAQHAIEQETAVQYWKDRCQTSQDEMAKLKERLQQVEDPALRGAIAKLLEDKPPEQAEPLSIPAIPLPRLLPADLPEFLARRRGQQPKHSLEG
jgi:chromosome segregation ATPase